MSKDTTERIEGKPPGRGWYLGRASQWRRPVASWFLDREGLHALAGAGFVGVAALFEVAFGFWAFYAVWIGLMVLFITYEVTEDWRIHDQAYRDVGGYVQGSVPALIAFALAHIFI